MNKYQLLGKAKFFAFFLGISVFVFAHVWHLFLEEIPFFRGQPIYVENFLKILRLVVIFSFTATLVKMYDRVAVEEKLKIAEKFQNMIAHFLKLFEKPKNNDDEVTSSEMQEKFENVISHISQLSEKQMGKDDKKVEGASLIHLNSWKELTIRFVDDFHFEFTTTNGFKKVLHFTDIGFDNKKTKNTPTPRIEWLYLRDQIILTECHTLYWKTRIPFEKRKSLEVEAKLNNRNIKQQAETRKKLNQLFSKLFGIVGANAFSGLNKLPDAPDHTQIRLSMNDDSNTYPKSNDICFDDNIDYQSKNEKVASKKHSE